MVSPEAVVAATRLWLRTPYLHQASLRGVGADCLGLVRGVYLDLYGKVPAEPPPYSAGWGESDGRELMLDAARRYLVERPDGDWQLGDVLLFRLKGGLAAKHCSIVTGPQMMIHAYSGKCVMEATIVPWWTSRIAGVFTWPDGADGDIRT